MCALRHSSRRNVLRHCSADPDVSKDTGQLSHSPGTDRASTNKDRSECSCRKSGSCHTHTVHLLSGGCPGLKSGDTEMLHLMKTSVLYTRPSWKIPWQYYKVGHDYRIVVSFTLFVTVSFNAVFTNHIIQFYVLTDHHTIQCWIFWTTLLASGLGLAQWLRRCAISRKVSASIPSAVAGDFFRSYRRNRVPWGRLSL